LSEGLIEHTFEVMDALRVLCGCRAALLAVWAAQAALLAFALKLKVSAAKSDADGPVPNARLGSFQVQSPL